MIGNTPYIIVDNQKISPIGRSPRSDSSTGGRTGREDQPFGVVDRVTISREAREKSKWQQAYFEAEPPALEGLPKKPQTTTTALLTYLPKKLR
ncbi:MAG: hypothetical protein HGJ94_03550 [Desulfosarcina sp.]|nr:hypothetical protein [Desulfosarcina sp.]